MNQTIATTTTLYSQSGGLAVHGGAQLKEHLVHLLGSEQAVRVRVVNVKREHAYKE